MGLPPSPQSCQCRSSEWCCSSCFPWSAQHKESSLRIVISSFRHACSLVLRHFFGEESYPFESLSAVSVALLLRKSLVLFLESFIPQASALFAVLLAGFPIERALRRVVVVLMAAFSITFLLQFMLRYLVRLTGR